MANAVVSIKSSLICIARLYTARMFSKNLAKLLLTTLLFPLALFAQTPVIALQNLAHTAENLEKTVPFYRDVLGLAVNGARDPLAQQPQILDEDMSKFTATDRKSVV